MNNYMEKLVARRLVGNSPKIVGIVLAALVLTAGALYLGIGFGALTLVPFVIFAIVYAAYRLIINMKIEFEYILADDELRIDSIIARRRRKRLLCCSASDIELLVPFSAHKLQESLNNGRKLLDCSVDRQTGDNSLLLASYKGQRIVAVFTPDERMIKALKRLNPYNVQYFMN